MSSLLDVLAPKKIPNLCRRCAEPLRRSDMERFLDACEKAGKDPFEVAFGVKPPGVHCLSCVASVRVERWEDEAQLRELERSAARYERKSKKAGLT